MISTRGIRFSSAVSSALAVACASKNSGGA
jgi:hypothetical protein